MQLFATIDEVIADLKKGRQQAVFAEEMRFYYSPSQFEIDTIDILNELKIHEVPFKFPEISEKELNELYEDNAYWYLEQCIHQTWGSSEEITSDNTYNWNAKISNHLQYKLYEAPAGRIIAVVEINLHGDVRANYSPWMILSCYTQENFYETLCAASKDVHIETEKWTANVTVPSCSSRLYVHADETENLKKPKLPLVSVDFETEEYEPEYLYKEIEKKLGLSEEEK